jgi:hypothetical protein
MAAIRQRFELKDSNRAHFLCLFKLSRPHCFYFSKFGWEKASQHQQHRLSFFPSAFGCMTISVLCTLQQTGNVPFRRNSQNSFVKSFLPSATMGVLQGVAMDSLNFTQALPFYALPFCAGGRATPEMALRPFQGWPVYRASDQQPSSTLLDTPRRTLYATPPASRPHYVAGSG